MRFKALSDVYGINAKRNYAISMTFGVFLVIILFILFMNHINKPDFEPLSLILILIPYSLISFPNKIFMAISSMQTNLIKMIGRERYITLNKDELLLEDNLDGRSIIRSYAWESVENIVIRNVTPFGKFNKNKIYTITFIFNQAEYNYFLVRPNFKTPKLIKYLDSFFTVMHSQELRNEIEKHWQGTIEKLPNKPK